VPFPATQARDDANQPRLSGGDVFEVQITTAADPGTLGVVGGVVDGAASPGGTLVAVGGVMDGAASPGGTLVAVGGVVDGGDGTYTCTYTVRQAGTLQLHVIDGGWGWRWGWADGLGAHHTKAKTAPAPSLL
jgi:hypothetical protein